MHPILDAPWTIPFLGSGLLLSHPSIFSLGVTVGKFGAVLMLRSLFEKLGGGREAVVVVLCAMSLSFRLGVVQGVCCGCNRFLVQTS